MTKVRLFKQFFKGFAAIISAAILVATQTAAAAYEPFSMAFYDPASTDSCAPTSSPLTQPGAPGSIYVLGDSLTVGMRDAGDMDGKLRALGWSPTKINAVGGEDLSWGRGQVAADASIIAESESILIGLGTNHVGDVVTGTSSRSTAATDSVVIDTGKETIKSLIQALVDEVRGNNPSIKIYWTNIFMTGILTTTDSYDMDKAMPVLNEALNEVAATNKITILPWASNPEVPQLVSGDGLHPSGAYPQMATFVTNALSGSLPTIPTAAGCVCSVGSVDAGTPEENEREVWAYLTSAPRNLSPEAAAGLMGSIHDESGFDPHNVQNTANANGIPDGPEMPINAIGTDGRTFRGNYGYGLIQWTFPTRQDALVAYAAQDGRSTGDLGLQLDFLWKELTENYQGTYALLTTPGTPEEPGVSVREASDEVTLNFVTPGSVTTEHGSPESRAATLTARGNQSQIYFDRYSGQTLSYSGGSGCNASGANVDLDSVDTSSIQCGGNTSDAGVVDEYRFGQPRRIRLCNVGGTQANSQIAASLEQLLADSAAANVPISFGAYRGMDTQISMYQSRCAEQGITPTAAPYPKASYDEYAKCDGIAPPGFSNHQMGLAIDVSCDGALIPRYHPEAAGNACFQWLVANAARYGLYEFRKGAGTRTSGSYEAWHWSVDGS